MRRLILNTVPLLLTAAFLFVPAGCKRQTSAESRSDEQAAPLASMVNAADPRTGTQFVKGFYGVEQNAWRWTSGDFVVNLKPPAGAAQKGANLMLKFVVPGAILDKLKSISLSATVNGQKLAPETYSKDGEFTYLRDVPASALQRDIATVEFTLDKFLPASAQDARDLGVIMSLVGFEAKP